MEDSGPSQHGRASRRTLRTQVLAILMVLWSVFAIVDIFLARSDVQDARRSAEADAAFAAGLARDSIDKTLTSTQAAIVQNASSGAFLGVLAPGAPCSLTGGGVDSFSGHLDLLLPSGRDVCSSVVTRGAPPGATYAGQSWITDVLAKRSAVVSAPFVDGLTGKLSVAIAAPIMTDTHIVGILVDVMQLENVATELHKTYGGRNGFRFTIIDAAPATILSSSEQPASVGRTVTGTSIATNRGSRIGLDGIRQIFASKPLNAAPWRILAGVPESAELDVARAGLSRAGILAIVTLFLATLCVFAVDRWVGKPVRALGDSIEEMTGAVEPRFVDVRGPAEVASLGRNFNGMVTAIRRWQSELAELNTELERRVDERTEQLGRSEAQFRKLFESSTAGILETNIDGKIVAANQEAARIVGYDSPEELIAKVGDGLNLLVDPTIRDRVRALFVDGVATQELEMGVRRRDGSSAQVLARVRVFRNDDGDPTSFETTLVDITERARAAEARTLLAAVIESSEDAIYTTDLNGIVTSWNEGATRMYGFEPLETIGHSIELLAPKQFAHEDQRILEAISAADRFEHFETQRATKYGSTIAVSLAASPLCDDRGSVTGVSFVARDISARKHAEARVREQTEAIARANSELEQFAYIASHDLQEPLRTLSNYADLLDRRLETNADAESRSILARIHERAERMQNLIVDLLAYSRAGTSEASLETVNPRTALDEAMNALEAVIEHTGARVTVGDLPDVLADRNDLALLLQNLIGNAVKFQGKDARPVVTISAERRGSDCVLSITDNGIGIDPRFAERIFEPFRRLHAQDEYAGTGIGLAICKKIVDRHGGRIWVESEPEKGATFKVALQAA